MARFVSVLGFLDGKLQNTVTATVKGQSTIRAYQPNVSNPKSEKQVSNRDVMTWITALANFLNFAVLVPYLAPKKRVQSPINSFNAQLGKLITLIATANNVMRGEVITSYLTDLTVSNLMVTNGPKSFLPTGSTTVTAGTATSTTATVTLATQTQNYSRADLQTDVLMFVAMNISNKKNPEVTISNVARSTGSFNSTIALPTREAGDIILLFAGYKGASDNITSKGMVFGRLIGTTFVATTARTYVA